MSSMVDVGIDRHGQAKMFGEGRYGRGGSERIGARK